MSRTSRSAILALALLAGAQDMASAHGMDHEAMQHDSMQMEGMTADVPSKASGESAFLKENDAAMTKMMAAMEIKPSGDVDRDFVEMMVPHHQGAIDMAQAVLRYSHNDQLRRLAQEIVVTQQQEIAAMRLAIGDPLPLAKAAPTQIEPARTAP